MQSRIDEIKKSGDVFGISVDSPFSLAKWQELEKFPSVPLLSDIRKEASTAYGVLVPARGTAQRAAFLIDKEGKIAKAQLVDVRGELPDMEAFIAEHKKLA